LGYDGGTLSCAANCVFVTDQCTTLPVHHRGGNIPFDLDDFRTSVIFSGRAYPFATVVVSEGSVIKASIVADVSADFRTTLETTAGNHLFGVYGVDKHGRRSPQLTFNVTVQDGVVNAVSGIFLPPTIGLARSPVKKGDLLGIMGLTVPQGTLSLYVDSAVQGLASGAARGDGSYYLSFPTAALVFGPHTVRSRVTAPDAVVSGFSEVLDFDVEAADECRAGIGDLNCDSRVDIADMSILLYWWENASDQGIKIADLNSDDKVELLDLSVMFFHWTG
jgi:hypothetical protein